MKKTYWLALCSILLAGCSSETERDTPMPIKVEVVATEGGFELQRDGTTYAIKGAGLEFGDIESFASHGGNSIRTWRLDNGQSTAIEILDRAHAVGVTVAMCLPMQPERSGFDYNDKDAVAAQLAEFRAAVETYRDHPALLVWIIGNELNHGYTNSAVYDAVNEISEMIHELDPNHPTTTTVAGAGREVVKDIEARAPDLDFISFQVYGDLFVLPRLIAEAELNKPFFVTEWGATGHWEVGKTDWGAPLEVNSSEKADTYRRGYQEMLQPMAGQLIGSYAFLWGQKQERTPTWYGLFTETGEETETIDVLHYLWNGSWPDNRSPRVRSITLDGGAAGDNVTLSAGQSYEAKVDITDPDDDPITYRWELKPESDSQQEGGDFEQPIENLDGLINDVASDRISLVAPGPGAYRLFAYAYDGAGHAAHANIPFLVAERGAD